MIAPAPVIPPAILPAEIVVAILARVRIQDTDTLVQAARVSRMWAGIATPLLWERVVLRDTRHVVAFIRSGLYSLASVSNNPYIIPLMDRVTVGVDDAGSEGCMSANAEETGGRAEERGDGGGNEQQQLRQEEDQDQEDAGNLAINMLGGLLAAMRGDTNAHVHHNHNHQHHHHHLQIHQASHAAASAAVAAAAAAGPGPAAALSALMRRMLQMRPELGIGAGIGGGRGDGGGAHANRFDGNGIGIGVGIDGGDGGNDGNGDDGISDGGGEGGGRMFEAGGLFDFLIDNDRDFPAPLALDDLSTAFADLVKEDDYLLGLLATRGLSDGAADFGLKSKKVEEMEDEDTKVVMGSVAAEHVHLENAVVTDADAEEGGSDPARIADITLTDTATMTSNSKDALGTEISGAMECTEDSQNGGGVKNDGAQAETEAVLAAAASKSSAEDCEDSGRQQQIQRVKQLLSGPLEDLPVFAQALGTHVRKLTLPSFDCAVAWLPVLSVLLPRLQCINFQHIHPDKLHSCHTPLLSPLIVSLLPLFRHIVSLSVDDTHHSSWSHICATLRLLTPNLRCLSLEAVDNQDAFDHPETLQDVFPHLTKLEFLRLDGVALGPNVSLVALSNSCGHMLKSLAIDYCVEVSMDALSILWEGCPNLSFLGLAGVMMMDAQQPAPRLISQRPHLRTLRFVDCDVSDELFAQVGKLATNLEMIRIVFEDDRCEGVLRTWRSLTDNTLLAFTPGGGCGKDRNTPATLKTLALTWCPSMTADGLRIALYANPITVLDLHKDPFCEIGTVNIGLLKGIAPALSGVEVFHFYGQKSNTDAEFHDFFSCAPFPSLRSVCLNHTPVSLDTIQMLRSHSPLLDSISLTECDELTEDDICTLINSFAVEAGCMQKGAAGYSNVVDKEDGNDEENGAKLVTASTTTTTTAAKTAASLLVGGQYPPRAKIKRLYTLWANEAYLEQKRLAKASEEAALQRQQQQQQQHQHQTEEEEERVEGMEGEIFQQPQVHQELGGEDQEEEISQRVEQADLFQGNQESNPVTSEIATTDETVDSDVVENKAVKSWPAFVVKEDRWFVDEGLDIISLWENAVKKECGDNFYI